MYLQTFEALSKRVLPKYTCQVPFNGAEYNTQSQYPQNGVCCKCLFIGGTVLLIHLSTFPANCPNDPGSPKTSDSVCLKLYKADCRA